MGRRAHQPDPSQCRQVEGLAAYGIPEADIAEMLQIDPKTLRKHYRQELDFGSVKANAQVAGFLFNSAKNGNVTAQIFWLKTRGHWKESTLEVPTLAPRLIVSWRGGPNGDGPEQQMIMPPPLIEHH
jgi:hypothetical protein